MSKKKKETLKSPRNTIAINAKFRNSAGSMASKAEIDVEETKPLHCKECLLDEFSQDSDCCCNCNICLGIED